MLGESTALTVHDLAVDGDDVMRELGLPAGPEVGRVLTRLLEAVLEDPSINTPESLSIRMRALADDPRVP